MNAQKIFLILVTLLILGNICFAQTISDTILIQIQTTDGNEFIGTITSEDNSKIVLKTENYGEITIQRADIKTRKKIDIHQI